MDPFLGPGVSLSSRHCEHHRTRKRHPLRVNQQRLSDSHDRCEPGAHAFRLDRELELRRFDRLHAPAVTEAGPDLRLLDATRPPLARFKIAEAEQVVPSADRHRSAQGTHERRSVGIVKDVEESTVEDSVEGLTEIGQPQRVPGDEAGGEIALACLSSLDLER